MDSQECAPKCDCPTQVSPLGIHPLPLRVTSIAPRQAVRHPDPLDELGRHSVHGREVEMDLGRDWGVRADRRPRRRRSSFPKRERTVPPAVCPRQDSNLRRTV